MVAKFCKNRLGHSYLVCTKGGKNMTGKYVYMKGRDGRRVPLEFGKRLTPRAGLVRY